MTLKINGVDHSCSTATKSPGLLVLEGVSPAPTHLGGTATLCAIGRRVPLAEYNLSEYDSVTYEAGVITAKMAEVDSGGD